MVMLMVMVMVMVKAHRVLRTRGAGPWRYHAAHPTSTSHHAEGADRQDRPARPILPPRPIMPKEPIVKIDPRGPRPTIPPPQGKVPDVAGEVVCQSVMRRRRCNKAPGCEWEGPRKAKKGGRCVASSGASDVVPETP